MAFMSTVEKIITYVLGEHDLKMGEHQAKCKALNTDTAILRGSNKALALFKSFVFLVILDRKIYWFICCGDQITAFYVFTC